MDTNLSSALLVGWREGRTARPGDGAQAARARAWSRRRREPRASHPLLTRNVSHYKLARRQALSSLGACAARSLVRRFVCMKNVVLLALLGSVVACNQAPERTGESKSEIVNGTMGWFHEQPAVVALYDSENDGLCTGTFISDSEVLTAAHCTGGLGADDETGEVSGQMSLIQIDDGPNGRQVKVLANSVRIIRDPRWDDLSSEVNNFDLAIVKFPARTWGTKAKISARQAQVGDDVEMFGYGLDQDSGSDDGSAGYFRKGYNTVESVEGGFIAFTGYSYTSELGGHGSNASAGQGDSGGPLFVNNEIVGVVSGGASPGYFEDYATNYYVDLLSTESQAFLSYALGRL
ncbi:S1 family peptidase [bacterium]|nr:MAG: S1 family peptidase [bacterium]